MMSEFGEALERAIGGAPGRSGSLRRVLVTHFATPLGPAIAGATEAGVCLLEFAEPNTIAARLGRLARQVRASFAPGSNEHLRLLEQELRGYFDGRLREFRVPLVLSGTPFQRRVWECLRDIPYGETRTYGEQAARLGQPRAVRAVGRANGDNRISIIIPCHRVVGVDGRLTGYGGGLWRKRALLEHERRALGVVSPALFAPLERAGPRPTAPRPRRR